MATFTVPNMLGGELVLGRMSDQGGGLAALVREGLPAEALFLLAKRLDLRQAEVSEKIGIPQRTLTRRLTRHARLTASESDRTVRLCTGVCHGGGDPGQRREGGAMAQGRRIARCAAAGPWTSWIQTRACARWKTCWGASLMAFIADAHLADLPCALMRRKGSAARERGGLRPMELARRADGLYVDFAGAGCD